MFNEIKMPKIKIFHQNDDSFEIERKTKYQSKYQHQKVTVLR
jgi:hypothetical protein